MYLASELSGSRPTVERLKPETAEFEPLPLPAELLGVLSASTTRRALSVSVVRLGTGTGKLIQLAPTVDRKIPAIVIPIIDQTATKESGTSDDFRSSPQPAAEVIIKLNLDVIRNEEKFFPALLSNTY